jgi:hypothetical protein
MTSLRQIEANRRNSRLSTGPTTEEGKKRSRRNAIRHGLTAETVIHPLEDSADYTAFELAVTVDYEPQTAVERELVLRLASLLWRLRRATAIETGLFTIQAEHQLPAGLSNGAIRECQNQVETWPAGSEDGKHNSNDETHGGFGGICSSAEDDESKRPEGLTQAYVRLSNLPNCPLDRLSRYEAALWRQAGQIIFVLQLLQRRVSWKGMIFRPK